MIIIKFWGSTYFEWQNWSILLDQYLNWLTSIIEPIVCVYAAYIWCSRLNYLPSQSVLFMQLSDCFETLFYLPAQPFLIGYRILFFQFLPMSNANLNLVINLVNFFALITGIHSSDDRPLKSALQILIYQMQEFLSLGK